MRGGIRERAGRKAGVPNLLSQLLSEKINAEKLIPSEAFIYTESYVKLLGSTGQTSGLPVSELTEC